MFKNSREMVDRIHSKAPVHMAGSAVVGIAATEAIAKVAIGTVLAGAFLSITGLRKVFEKAARPFETGCLVMLIIIIAAFAQAAFSLGGKPIVTPMMMVLLVASMLTAFKMKCQIEILESIDKDYVRGLEIPVFFGTVALFSLAAASIWKATIIQDAVIGVLPYGYDTAAIRNLITFADLWFILITINQRSISLYVKSRICSEASDYIQLHKGKAHVVKAIEERRTKMLAEISIVRRITKNTLKNFLGIASTGAAYSALIWLIGTVNLTTYQFSVFTF